MKGLELSKAYYEAHGLPMLEQEYPELMKYIAVGLVGSGSERYGFDDDISQDHDFEPGFCIFLPAEDIVDRRSAFLLERAYSKLPKEFMGFSRQPLSPVGGNRNGVFRTADFYLAATGAADGRLSTDQWLHIPDYALAEAVNGELFFDGYGEFSEIRGILSRMPEDIKRKRLAGNILLMAQSGQYNFSRCLGHGEPEAAQLACFEFVTAAMKVFFLLSGRYMPYYKWSFRAFRELSGRSDIAEALSFLLSGDNHDAGTAEKKRAIIESVSADLIAELLGKGLTRAQGRDLERHAYSVNDGISDGEIRNMNIFTAV